VKSRGGPSRLVDSRRAGVTTSWLRRARASARSGRGTLVVSRRVSSYVSSGHRVERLDKAEAGADPEVLRDGLKLLVRELMDAEVTQLVGAGLPRISNPRPQTHRSQRSVVRPGSPQSDSGVPRAQQYQGPARQVGF
jgi:hypothetical protein